MSAPNHYEVIGLPLTASQTDIDNRYRELSRLYRMDGGAPGEGMAALISEAHRVLSNSSLRVLYDGSLSGLTASESTAQATPALSSPSPSAGPAASNPPPVMERTQAFPPPVSPAAPDLSMERTMAYPVPASGQLDQSGRTGVSDTEDEDKKLAAELSRRGIPPDEVRRLVALGRKDSPPLSSGKRSAPVVAPPIPPPVPYVPKPTISLPDPRESSVQERMEADRMLTAANIARRRNNFREAEQQCRQAVELVPSDAAALELYGDVLQATGRVDDAILAYKRAVEVDASRRTAEKKYGDLVLRQDRSIAMIQDEFVPGNAYVAVLLSAVFPGAGQFYNGQAIKGLVTAAAFLVISYVIFYTRFGLPHEREGVPTSLGIAILLAGIVYMFAVVDANFTARRGKRRGSGWEV